MLRVKYELIVLTIPSTMYMCWRLYWRFGIWWGNNYYWVVILPFMLIGLIIKQIANKSDPGRVRPHQFRIPGMTYLPEIKVGNKEEDQEPDSNVSIYKECSYC